MTDVVLVERDGDIAIVILNRPDKLNAFTKAMWARLGDAVEELSADTALRCIVMRGAGDRAFSPGNDISEFADERSNSIQAEAYGKFMNTTIEALHACSVPKVAMIKGVCVGGGLEVAGLCDIRICGESSRFGAPISKLGLVMGYQEIGALKDLVVGDDEVEAEAMATARRIADGAPLVHRWHRKFLARLADPTPLSDEEIKEAYACYDTEDFKTGYQAFLDKKKPDFKGR